MEKVMRVKVTSNRKILQRIRSEGRKEGKECWKTRATSWWRKWWWKEREKIWWDTWNCLKLTASCIKIFACWRMENLYESKVINTFETWNERTGFRRFLFDVYDVSNKMKSERERTNWIALRQLLKPTLSLSSLSLSSSWVHNIILLLQPPSSSPSLLSLLFTTLFFNSFTVY